MAMSLDDIKVASNTPSVKPDTLGNRTEEEVSLLHPVDTIDKEEYHKSQTTSPVTQYLGRIGTNLTFGVEKLVAKNGLVVLGDKLISPIRAERERRETIRTGIRPNLTTPEDFEFTRPIISAVSETAAFLNPTLPRMLTSFVTEHGPELMSSMENAKLADDIKVWDEEAKKYGLTGPELERMGEITEGGAFPTRKLGMDLPLSKEVDSLGRYIRNVGWAWYHNAQDRYESIRPEIVAGEKNNPVATMFADATTSIFAAVGAATTMGVEIPAVLFGAFQGTEEYVGARAAGKTRELALALGITSGLTEGGLEYVGLSNFLKAGAGRLRFIGKGLLTEFSQEFSQQGMQGVLETAFGVKEFNENTFTEVLLDSLIAGGIGAVMGGVTAGGLAMSTHKNVTKTLTRDFGLSRERAKAVADKWISGMALEVTDILSDMGSFTPSELEYVDKQVEAARVAAGLPTKRPGEPPNATTPPEPKVDQMANLALKARAENLASEILALEKSLSKQAEEIIPPSPTEGGKVDAEVDTDFNFGAKAISTKQDILMDIYNKIDSATPPQRFPIKDEDGYFTGWTGNKSGYPKYFQNKGYTREETLKILQKALDGEKLTDKQQHILDDLYAGELALTGEKVLTKETVKPAEPQKQPAKSDVNKFKATREQLQEKQIELYSYLLGDMAGEVTDVEIDPAKPVKIKAGTLNRARRMYAQKQIQRFKEGYNAGRAIAKDDIKAFQTYLTKLTTEANYLTDKQKTRILATIKSTQTEGQFRKRLPELEMRIAEMEQANIKKTILTGINKIFEKSEGKGKGVHRRVKLDPDTQAVFDKLRAMKANPALTIEGFEPTGDLVFDLLANDLLTIESVFPTTEQLLTAYDNISSAYIYGVGKAKQQRAKYNKDLADKVDDVIFDLKSALKEKSEKVLTPDQKVKPQSFFGLHRFLPGWRTFPGLMRTLARATGQELGKSRLERITDTTKATRYTEAIRQEYMTQIQAKMKEIFNLKDDDAVRRRLQDDTDSVITLRIEVPTQTTTDEEGATVVIRTEEQAVTLNRLEARKRWMEWQSSEGRQRLERGNYFTEEHIKEIEEFLTEQDFAFIKYQRETYDALYARVNNVFRQLKGYNLPYRDFYTPFYSTTIDISGEHIIDVMLGEANMRPSIDSKSALQPLSKKGTGLLPVNDLLAFDKYVMDMTHFIGWAKAATELKTIFGDSRVKNLIVQTSSENVLSRVEYLVDTLVRGSIQKVAGNTWAKIEKMRLNWVKGVLAANPKVGFPKQISSFLLYAAEMPSVDFVKGVMDLPRAIASGDIRVLVDNPFMTSRGYNFTRDLRMLKDMAREDDPFFMKQNPKVDEFLLWFMKAGDRGAIYAGGWAKYKYLTEQKKMSPERALDEVIRATNRTQQSSDLEQMPAVFLDANPIVRLLTTFRLTPNQFFEAEMDALINARRIGIPELAKRLAIYHIIQPMLWQFLADGFRFEDKKQLRAAILGPYGTIAIVGDALTNLVDFVISSAAGESSRDAGLDTIIGSWIKDTTDTIRLMGEMIDSGIEYEAFADALRELSNTIAPFAGAPAGVIRYGGSVMRGAMAITEGEFADALKYFLDYSNYAVKGKSGSGGGGAG
jgi:hypothetical protein